MNIQDETFTSLKSDEELKERKPAEKTVRRIRNESPPPLRPYGKKPWRTIFTSFFLLIAGFFFVIMGYMRGSDKTWQEILPFYILGTLLLIPGIYHTVIILLIWKGVDGFNYDMLPTLED